MSTISIVDSSLDSVSISATAPRNHSPYAIRVRHLWHRFGAFDVLRDVTFDVEHGQIFGFIGPNGAGKTTTIRIIATLLEPMAGRVEVDGYDVAVDSESVRAIIGYMPDHAGVYERVTVREYLEFFADAYQIPHLGVVETVMELTDLEKLQDKLVVEMSKGMKQRLQLARVLLHDPKILVLDEPASDLDPRARIEMRDCCSNFARWEKRFFYRRISLRNLRMYAHRWRFWSEGHWWLPAPSRGLRNSLNVGVTPWRTVITQPRIGQHSFRRRRRGNHSRRVRRGWKRQGGSRRFNPR